MGKLNWWHSLYDLLIEKGLSAQWASALNIILLLSIATVFVFLLDFLIWKFLRKISSSIASRTKTNFDNFAVANRLPRFLAHILPLTLALELTPWVFYDFQYAENIAFKVLNIFGVVLALRIARSLLSTVRDYLNR